jgi:hypothetical protein
LKQKGFGAAERREKRAKVFVAYKGGRACIFVVVRCFCRQWPLPLVQQCLISRCFGVVAAR